METDHGIQSSANAGEMTCVMSGAERGSGITPLGMCFHVQLQKAFIIDAIGCVGNWVFLLIDFKGVLVKRYTSPLPEKGNFIICIIVVFMFYFWKLVLECDEHMRLRYAVIILRLIDIETYIEEAFSDKLKRNQRGITKLLRFQRNCLFF